MTAAAFDPLGAARELEAAGMDRELAEVTALNMQKAGNAHQDQLAARADLEKHQVATEATLENHRLANRTDLEKHQIATEAALEKHRIETKADIDSGLANLRADMLRVALGIVIANAAFVVANTGIVIAVVKFL